MKVYYYVHYEDEMPVRIFKFVIDDNGNGIGYRYEHGKWAENSKVFDIRMDGSTDYDSYCESEIDINSIIEQFTQIEERRDSERADKLAQEYGFFRAEYLTTWRGYKVYEPKKSK